MAPLEPFVLVRATAGEAGLDPQGVPDNPWAPFKFQCPVVSAHGRSVVCSDGVDGRADLYCADGCTPDAIVNALGLKRRDVLDAPAAPAPSAKPPAAKVNGSPAPAPTPAYRVRTLGQMTARAVEWGWHPYLPLGKVTILAGAAGQGKSQFTLLVAALVTRGMLPGALTEPRDVVIITGEDDPEDTVLPRILAAGGDPDRCLTVDVRNADGRYDLLTLPTQGGILHDVVAQRPVGLVVLDPISAFMDSDISTYRNVDVRRALAPLKELAEKYRLMSLVVQHLNKGGDVAGGDPLARVTDSGAYVQMARSVLMMGPDPDDDDGDRGDRKLLVVAKSNIAPPGSHGLNLALETTNVTIASGEVLGTSMVALGDASRYGAEDLFLSFDARGELERAQAWIHKTLAARWVARDDLDALAKRESISYGTLRRALSAIGKRAKESGVQHGRWFWTTKDNPEPPPWNQGAHAANTPDVGHVAQVEPEGGQVGQGAQHGGYYASAQVDDLEDYRRNRDRMLGERWDDDDDA